MVAISSGKFLAVRFVRVNDVDSGVYVAKAGEPQGVELLRVEQLRRFQARVFPQGRQVGRVGVEGDGHGVLYQVWYCTCDEDSRDI